MADTYKPLDLPNSEIAFLMEQADYQDHYQFFDTEVTLNTDSTKVLEYFRILYRSFLLPTSKWGNRAQAYHILTENVMENRPLLLWEETKVCTLPSEPDLYSAADAILFSSIVSKVHSYFLIHGAAVSIGQHAVIMSGLTGCGKTTLVLELVRRGMKFLSDELVPVSRTDGIIEAFPRALGLRNNTLRLFHDLDLSHGRTFSVSEDQNKCLINIDDLFEHSISQRCRSAVVLLLETSENKNGTVRKEYHTVDIAMRNIDKEFILELKKLEGIEYISQQNENGRYVVRIQMGKEKGVQQAFNQLCDSYGETILYRVKAVESPPNGEGKPRLIPLANTKTAVELLANLQNIAVYKESDNNGRSFRITKTLFELTDAIADAQCYRLLIGNLMKTADLVQGLLSTDSMDSHR